MQGKTRKCRKIKQKGRKDRISALPEDLQLKILLLLPTQEAVATTILSKRWRSAWMMLPRLDYFGRGDESLCRFIDKSLLQLSKAPVIEKLSVHLGRPCPFDVKVEQWVDNVVNRCIQWLNFNLFWSAEPTSFKRLYTCKTLKKLTLTNKILVDVPSEASLPSLVELGLERVVYKNEDSLVRLLSSCPLLQNLFVDRYDDVNDNVTNFNVKVPSLQILRYENHNTGGSVVIDSPSLKILSIFDCSYTSCLIEKMPPCLDIAKVEFDSHPSDKVLRALSSVMYLNLTVTDKADAICSAVNFSRLIECKLTPFNSENWVQSTINLLHNSPKLRVVMINSEDIDDDDDDESEDLPLLSSVPECLSSRLEIFEWEEYGGTREEKKILTYILAHSKCLKTVRISLSYYNFHDICHITREEKKMMKELQSIYRVSESYSV